VGDPDHPGAAYSDVTDAQLLERHGAGDAAAFGEVVRRHRDRLWAVALRTLGDPEEAADAMQDALVSALRATRGSPGGGGGAAAFRGEASVTTWLHRVVINACIDRVRRRAARPADPLPEREQAMAQARDAISAKETALVVTAALATLSVDQRAALVLVDMHGFSVEEAARILAVPTGTVKSRCARGRARLLPLLADLGGSKRVAGSGNHAGSSPVPSSADIAPAPHAAQASAPARIEGGDRGEP
jgi:RNA polymerase sigma-70 factor (ECF subfamily)